MSANPRSEAGETPESRAVLANPQNFFAFADELPRVPRRQFLSERDRAFDPNTPTGEVLLDSADVLGTDWPATTPLLLARYLRIRAGEALTIERAASAEVFYVLQGSGQSTSCGETMHWSRGDVMCLPGGVEAHHSATEDAVLFSCCNEPLLAFERLRPARAGESRVSPVHWRHERIEAELQAIRERALSADAAGLAVQMVNTAMGSVPMPTPSMNMAVGALEPGCDQRPHRHNGAAITLGIATEGVYSMIEEQRVDWSPGAVQITPAAELHSHHNRGPSLMRSLVVQDEGLHFYARTPGFSWT